MNYLERFLNVMEYRPVDQVPNWEAGVWPQTRERWEKEGLDPHAYHWDWFSGEEALGMDPREFIQFSSSMFPPYEYEEVEEDERTLTYRDEKGILRRALKEGSIGGARMSMDQFIDFPVKNMADWQEVKKRYVPSSQSRFTPNWRTTRLDGWRKRTHPLIFGPNCSTLGFYWLSRELMGTENLSYAWFDQPDLMYDILETQADFLIEGARPILAETSVEYIILSEDLSMKTGPLLSPKTYHQFIYPRLRRVIEFFKAHGVTYVFIDTDGNPEVLIPQFLDAGVDGIWPLERTADQDPIRLRKTYGRSLRLLGGVDKRVLATTHEEIDAHLRTFLPLIEEGGFIPTVDHTVPPDVSWENFLYYMRRKKDLLSGNF